ncbi:hypothetical protein MT391_16805 [Vibrio sp. 1-Bac 57]
MKEEAIIYEVTIEWLEDRKLVNTSFDPIKMDYAPRVGDVINVDGIYNEVISIVYKSNQPIWLTAYVNIIGDSLEHEKWVKEKLIDVTPSNPQITFI